MSEPNIRSETGNSGQELVIGIVAPVGSNISLVVKVIEEELAKVSYDCITVRVSKLLHQIDKYSRLSDTSGMSEYDRISSHMSAGTELRSLTKRGDIMALLSIGQIRELRSSHLNTGDALTPSPRVAYLLRSLKHPDEVQRLREVYGDAFILISAYAPRSERVELLSQALSKSEQDCDPSKHRSAAEQLINRDEDEEGNKLGQNVSDAFPLADLFVDSRRKECLSESISRFIEAFFGYPYHTPTKDEFSMFMAKAAAFRSADLSRQVGAVITTKDGDVISVGCNDVPKYGGGLYWAEDDNDARDFRIGHEPGAVFRRNMLAEIVNKMQRANWLSEDKNNKKVDELLAELLKKGGGLLSDAQIMNVIEYGRSVHAEMAALSDAARRGIPVHGATLYTTTFPCHLCARHIIAAGIDRVVYIEPYPKSQTGHLYSDAVVIDPSADIKSRVHFEPFVGVSPTRFQHLFELRTKRKDGITGHTVEWDKSTASPDIYQFVASHILIEDYLVGTELPNILSESDLTPVS